MSWENIIKIDQDLDVDSPLALPALHEARKSINSAIKEVSDLLNPNLLDTMREEMGDNYDRWETNMLKFARESVNELRGMAKNIATIQRKLQGSTKMKLGTHERDE